MAGDRLRVWEALFARALEIIDSVGPAGIAPDDWSFGGGTVLMLRHRHRISKDVDIFVSDPQYLGFLTPRLNTKAESLTSSYIEQAGFLKLYFPEGEIDFVASAPLTQAPTTTESLLGRKVEMETSAEIIAKKLWHRGEQFTARDLFDLALVAEAEPGALWQIRPVLESRREPVLRRIESQEVALREAFAALEILDYSRSFDECIELVREALR